MISTKQHPARSPHPLRHKVGDEGRGEVVRLISLNPCSTPSGLKGRHVIAWAEGPSKKSQFSSRPVGAQPTFPAPTAPRHIDNPNGIAAPAQWLRGTSYLDIPLSNHFKWLNNPLRVLRIASHARITTQRVEKAREKQKIEAKRFSINPTVI
jgi:hypothetical protein